MKDQNTKKEIATSSRLKSYLALTAGFVAISPLAEAQIIYTDINPDSVLTGVESFQLDINNDGIFDFSLKQKIFSWNNIKHYSNSFAGLNSNKVFSGGNTSLCSTWYYVPKPLNFWDDMVTQYRYKIWDNGGRLSIDPPDPCRRTGMWKGAKDKYLGFQFKINGDFYFGWARMDVDSSGKSLTLKDYAYYNDAGKPIRAGSMKVSLPEDNPLKNIRVFSTEASIRIEAPINENLTGSIRLSDINGRELRSVNVKNEKNIELNTQDLPSGVYIINILTENGTLNKKVLIR